MKSGEIKREYGRRVMAKYFPINSRHSSIPVNARHSSIYLAAFRTPLSLSSMASWWHLMLRLSIELNNVAPEVERARTSLLARTIRC
ncbi:hypothetical protein AAHA92_03615 [Salvia divinorum]|uniref:Uncharacterized protein n=1 Tax=Salvia divinorum TaxID=28513 RepID=A0ABD1IHN5_SALDI